MTAMQHLEWSVEDEQVRETPNAEMGLPSLVEPSETATFR
jgi:hypothetical protein